LFIEKLLLAGLIGFC